MNGGESRGGDIDPADHRRESSDQRADRNWSDILQELRVTQTGTQIISGFLLTVAFQQRFTQLTPVELVIYAVLVALAALSTTLGLTVVGLHRAAFHHHEKPTIVVVGDRILRATVLCVGVLSVGVVLLIFYVVFGALAGVLAAVVAAALVALALILLPTFVARRRPPREWPTRRIGA